MDDQKEKEIEVLKLLVGNLWARLEEVTVVSETLRELLQKHKILSAAEIETMLAEGRKIQNTRMVEVLEKGADAVLEDRWRRILENMEGPKQ
jgi:hypothetical protein